MESGSTFTLPKCPNRNHNSNSYSIVRHGSYQSGQAAHLRFLCRSSDGTSHSFSLMADGKSSRDARIKNQLIKCPNPRHRGSKVISRGTRASKSGTWTRFFCRSLNDERHYFRVLVSADGAANISLTKPPICLEHPKAKIVRNGKKGSGVAKRQSYLCYSIGNPPHRFSPPLSREAVAPLASCSGCDELLSPHRGSLTASRHTPWTLAAVVQALNNLSLGLSYAAVSRDLRAQRTMAEEHLNLEHGIELGSRSSGRSEGGSRSSTGSTRTDSIITDDGATSSSSRIREEGQNAWHLAADLVEEYSPLLFGAVMEKVLSREKKAREVNDVILNENPNATLKAPIVYLLDDVPIYIKQWKSGRSRHQQDSWSLLVVVELLWQSAKDPSELPKREARLRLARAYPRANEDAWMLVLDELPVTPDFVIADAGIAIKNAVARRYAGQNVTFIPSLFHIQKNIRKFLEKLPNASSKTGKRIFLARPLYEAVDFLSRDELIQSSKEQLAKDWDDLVDLVVKMGGSAKEINKQRTFNEPKMLDAISILTNNPQLPASNAAVEAKIRLSLEPFLENRQARFRNLARTNYLLDLAVARSQGAFSDLNRLSKLIRQSNEAAKGWAPTPRQITDRQPVGAGANTPIYSSLLNAQIISRLSVVRGIAPATLKTSFPSKKIKNPGVGSGRPKGSKNKPKQVTP